MKYNYYPIDDLLMVLDDPNRTACQKILADNLALFKKVQGASHNHQAWPGGYYDHILETLNIARVLYDQLDRLRPLPFNMPDALLVLFLHDLEKPWKYRLNDKGETKYVDELKTKQAAQKFRDKKMAEYGIVLTPEQENSLKYVEGEFGDYTNQHRVMGPLAAFCHMCDVASARIWFDCPKNDGDGWNKLGRIAKK